jgi:hypothetical protein
MQGNSLLNFLSVFRLTMMNNCLCINDPFFLSRSIGMATDIYSMAPGGIGRILGLGIWSKGLRKTWETLEFFLSSAPLFHCRFCNHCTSKHYYITTRLFSSLYLLPLALCWAATQLSSSSSFPWS